MSIFLLLVLTVFVARVVSAGFVRFCLFLLCSFCLLTCNKYSPSGESFGCAFLSLFVFFLLVSCSSFWVCCFLAVAIRDKYRRPGPCGHSNAFFSCPPIVHGPAAPIPVIHGQPRFSGLVCVFVALAHVYFWPRHRCAGSAQVCLTACLALGVSPVCR